MPFCCDLSYKSACNTNNSMAFDRKKIFLSEGLNLQSLIELITFCVLISIWRFFSEKVDGLPHATWSAKYLRESLPPLAMRRNASLWNCSIKVFIRVECTFMDPEKDSL